jgi:hypothetical protein
MLFLVLAAAVVALVVILVAFGGGPLDSKPVASVPVYWKVQPAWPPGRGSDPAHGCPEVKEQLEKQQQERPSLAIFLDVSAPIGGFLPLQPRDSSPFRSVIVNLVPEQMERVSGSTSASFAWFFVSDQVSLKTQRPTTLTRQNFGGDDSRLNEAVACILQEFDTGKLRAAALITDLVSTDGSLTGAMGVAKALKDRMGSEGVRRGDLHVGLLGLRAKYLGVQRLEPCPPGSQQWCWYSEQAHRYKPLHHDPNVPFYVLVVGHGFGAVNEIGEGVRAGATQLGLEARWQVMTAVTNERQLKAAECIAYRAGRRREPQYTLVRLENGKFRCQQEDDVELLCPLPPDLGFEPQKVTASWPGASGTLESNTAVVRLSCSHLRASPPKDDLVVKVEGPAILNLTPWKEWSTESDDREEDLGRTLQLTSFLDTVRPRPERLEATAGVLPGGVER